MRFKGFWKEMGQLYKNYGAWLRKYWFAYLLLCIGITIPCLVWLYWDYITDYISEKKQKESLKDEQVLEES